MDQIANQFDREDPANVLKDQANTPATTANGVAGSAPSPSSSQNAGGTVGDGNSGGDGKSISGGGDRKVITWSTTNFEDGEVFRTGSSKTRDFGFKRNDTNDVKLDEVKWQVIKDEEIETLGSAKFSNFKPDGQFTAVTNESVSLNFAFTGEAKEYYGEEMYIQIDWATEWATGYSKTSIFTVTDSNSESEREKLQDKLDEDEDEQGALESTILPGASSTSGSLAPSSSETAKSSGDDSSGGGGGLSTGATAGIAVGGVIGGLLLIGAPVWLLLRRRRRNKQAGDEYTTQQTYAVDKETRGRATDSPNSPYSDENHIQPVALESLNRDRDAAATPRPGSVPRSSIGSHGRGSNSGAQTPQGMSSNVAHLVEDGMTADEIRRLEEEERQLDDEIERAARR